MNSRIKELRNLLGLTQTEFGNKIGIKTSSLSDMERSQARVTQRTIISICSVFNVNENWLKTGEGEIFNRMDKNYEEFFSIFKNLTPVLQDFLIKVANDLLDTQTKL